MIDSELLKLVADLGGLGVAGLLILLAYRFSSAIAPKFLDLVGNHFKENSATMQALKDSVDALREYLQNGGRPPGAPPATP